MSKQKLAMVWYRADNAVVGALVCAKARVTNKHEARVIKKRGQSPSI